MSATAPLTKLEAVNLMLHDIGERPVNTLAGVTRLDVTRAVESLEQVTRALQTNGWFFNRERLSWLVDSDGHYNVPLDIVKVEVIEGGPSRFSDGQTPELAVRGRVLYDLANGTDTFVDAPAIKVAVVRLLEFEDMPTAAREYVYATASVRFQSRAIGSKNVDADLRIQANSALAVLNNEEIDFGNYDQTFSPHFLKMMHRR